MFPYYIVPLVEEYRQLDPNSERARELSRKIAVNIGDYASLRLVLGIDPPAFAKFYPDMETASPSTFDTIDSFLDKFGKDLPPAGYVPQEAEEETQPELQPAPAVEPEPEYETSSSPQTLKELINRHEYTRALEFIEHQNLINPEKSIYFAHQMRFLKKLIALENYKNKHKG